MREWSRDRRPALPEDAEGMHVARHQVPPRRLLEVTVLLEDGAGAGAGAGASAGVGRVSESVAGQLGPREA